jgi:glutamine amidotransferase
MQILMDKSEEGPGSGLGLISGEVKRFRFSGEQQHLKVPHMGWNTVTPAGDHPLFAQYTDEIRFYFVHAYYVSPSDNADVIGSTPYGSEFCSAVAHGNIMGVQFHPEKSHAFGMRLLQQFAAL